MSTQEVLRNSLVPLSELPSPDSQWFVREEVVKILGYKSPREIRDWINIARGPLGQKEWLEQHVRPIDGTEEYSQRVVEVLGRLTGREPNFSQVQPSLEAEGGIQISAESGVVFSNINDDEKTNGAVARLPRKKPTPTQSEMRVKEVL